MLNTNLHEVCLYASIKKCNIQLMMFFVFYTHTKPVACIKCILLLLNELKVESYKLV